MRPYDKQKHDVTVRFAETLFYQVFCIPSGSSFVLDTLFGPATKRQTVFQLEMAILTGMNTSHYINLYRSDQVALSCHITVVSIRGAQGCDRNGDGDTVAVGEERWTVLTIRSASVVGNSKMWGGGLLGIHRLLPERLEIVGYRPPKCAASVTPNPLAASASSAAATATERQDS
eukprot:gene5244-5775_t